MAGSGGGISEADADSPNYAERQENDFRSSNEGGGDEARPNITPPEVATIRGPMRSCNRPAKIIMIANAAVETVKGMAAWVLVQFHWVTSALP